VPKKALLLALETNVARRLIINWCYAQFYGVHTIRLREKEPL